MVSKEYVLLSVCLDNYYLFSPHPRTALPNLPNLPSATHPVPLCSTLQLPLVCCNFQVNSQQRHTGSSQKNPSNTTFLSMRALTQASLLYPTTSFYKAFGNLVSIRPLHLCQINHWAQKLLWELATSAAWMNSGRCPTPE